MSVFLGGWQAQEPIVGEDDMAETLYQRLGGAEGISAIVRDTLDLHLKNPHISTRYQGKDVEKLQRLSVEFFSMGTGGPAK